jgi:hypothetical protein
MLINKTVTKKVLESIVQDTFLKFGNLSSSSFLDALKFLGFYYATNAGISINIEDLKTPDIKSKFLLDTNFEIQIVNTNWKNGLISDNERFQSIIDNWNITTESLKNRIIDYYQQFDPVNNLYIMAFSGARGNMSQVRQLVGMRGLMSDQEGKIIDLPIQANFREGLSSIDYIISSYGARKGIVDTALKTADSGYLTRRLIYVAQDLIIREFDCQTKMGLLLLLKNKTNNQNFIGRSIFSVKKIIFPFNELLEKETILDEKLFQKIKKIAPVIINLRSSLTCKSHGSICQMCYGWNLAYKKLISLGEVVGILAAQSIGEPGTQLTMRTFHTGGIFTSETLKQVVAPFSGKIFIPNYLKYICIRTNHGINVFKLQQEIKLQLIDWKGVEKNISLQVGSFLYIKKSCFLQKGQLIAEYSTQTTLLGPRKSKPIYTYFSGEIKFENIILKKKIEEKTRVTNDEGIVWIMLGSNLQLPKEIKFKSPNKLKKTKALAKLKIITTIDGVISLKENILCITNFHLKKKLNLLNLLFILNNCSVKIIPIIKNYQYIDNYTVLAFIYIYPLEEGKIISIREQKLKSHYNEEQSNTISSNILIIKESDTWQIQSDHLNNSFFIKDKKIFIKTNHLINSTSLSQYSGFFLKKDGFKFIFQYALPIFLSPNSAIYSTSGEFIEKKKLLATLVKYTQQTEDIVQGLPKIEELIEARKPHNACVLSKQAGIMLHISEPLGFTSQDECIKIKLKNPFELETKLKSELDVESELIQNSYFGHKLNYHSQIITFNNCLYKTTFIPSSYLIYLNNIDKSLKMHKILKNKTEEMLVKLEIIKEEQIIDKSESSYEKLFINKKKQLILQTKQKKLFLLNKLDVISQYKLSLKTQLRYQPGIFIDIGEPINDGMIDVHQLLQIFFIYHSKLDGILKGTFRSLTKFQLLLVNSIQAIYQLQGVNISSKHVEIIVRQMTSKVLILESGDTPLLKGELLSISLITELYNSLHSNHYKSSLSYRMPKYEPKLHSATSSSLMKDSFLSAAGFQETRRILSKAAIMGTNDWLRGLKESLITGRIIPAGSVFLNYKNYLNNIYNFKN